MTSLTSADSAATHAGVTLRLAAANFAATETVLEVHASTSVDGAVFNALGAYQGLRSGPTLFRLRDQSGREFLERPWPRGQALSNPSNDTHTALFAALPPDAIELELEIPFAYLDDPSGRIDLNLPVRAPVIGTLGRNTARVLATRTSAATVDRWSGPTIAIDVDLGGWQDDWRVLKPCQAELDGASPGQMIWHMRASDPQPPQFIELPVALPLEPKRLTLRGATVQIRGPWRLRFSRRRGL